MIFVDIDVCCNALPIASATLINLLELIGCQRVEATVLGEILQEGEGNGVERGLRRHGVWWSAMLQCERRGFRLKQVLRIPASVTAIELVYERMANEDR